MILGDFHIPYKCLQIPQEFKQYLNPGKVDHVLCTGNVCTNENLELQEEIVTLQFKKIEGLPEVKLVKVMGSKLLLIHGHQAIPWNDYNYFDRLQKEYEVDFIVTGHSHEQNIIKRNNYYILNPGSFTGAQNQDFIETTPSFLLLKLFKDSKGIMYNYQIKRGQEKPVTIDKININFEEENQK